MDISDPKVKELYGELKDSSDRYKNVHPILFRFSKFDNWWRGNYKYVLALIFMLGLVFIIGNYFDGKNDRQKRFEECIKNRFASQETIDQCYADTQYSGGYEE